LSAQPWMKFYPRDWRGDQALRAVSVAARGFWMECLCIMHEAKPYGHLLLNGEKAEGDTLARMTGTSTEEASALIAELTKAGVLSVTNKGVVFSRRMTKDFSRATKGRKAVEKRYSQDTENKEKKKPPTRSDEGDLLLRSQKPDTRKKESSHSLPLGAVPDETDKALAEYQRIAEQCGLPKIAKLTAKRRSHLKARLSDFGLDGWVRALASIPVSPFLSGKNDRGWRPDFDWLVNPTNLAKVIEGKYAGRAAPPVQQTAQGEYQARNPADFDMNDWIVRIKLFRETGRWAETWGPAPPADGDLNDIATDCLRRHRRAA
jgi:hypothetical protein